MKKTCFKIILCCFLSLPLFFVLVLTSHAANPTPSSLSLIKNADSSWTATYYTRNNSGIEVPLGQPIQLRNEDVMAGVKQLDADKGKMRMYANNVGAQISDLKSMTSFQNGATKNRQNNPVLGDEKEVTVWDYAGNIFIYILSLTFYLTSLLIGALIDFSSQLIDFGFGATRLAGSVTVQEGWTFTRDILNFVFILVLLAISFSTIAGLETFNMRKTLPRLLFAAFLVNFSLAISGAFLQVANVMTNTIADSVMPATTDACKDKVSGKDKGIGCRLAIGLTSAGQIGQLYTFKNVEWVDTLTDGKFRIRALLPNDENGATPDPSIITKKKSAEYFMVVIKSAMSVIMLGVFAVAFIFLGILIFVRLIMLIILLILAPVPYVFSLIPKAQKYADDWWSKFINYTFFLPIATFFLALAIRLLQRTESKDTSSLVGQFWPDGTLATSGAAGTFNGVLGSLIDVVFVSVFIFGAVYVAKSLSIFGANGALRAARGTVLGAGKLGMLPARLVGGAAVGGAKKGGELTARGIGNVAGKIPYVAGGVKNARTAGRFAKRIYGGQNIDAQLGEDEKALAGMSEDQLRASFNRGNAAAGMKLMKNGDLDKDKDEYQKLLSMVPKSEARDKINESWKTKDPVKAVMGSTLRDKLLSGTALSSQEQTKVDTQRAALQKAFRKIKPEDYAKLDAKDLEAAIAAKIDVPMTKGQLDATIGSTNTALQAVATRHLNSIKNDPKLSPGMLATVAYAKNKLNIIS